MKKKLLGTALLAASTTAFTSGCGILETLETVEVPQLRFDSNSYVVQPGDTLNSVASRYKIDPDSLLNVNSLQLAELIPGQRLLLLRDDEMTSLAAIANRSRTAGSVLTGQGTTGIASGNPATAAGGVVSTGQTVLAPNATRITDGGSFDPSVISTDIIVNAPGQEEIIGVVNAGDELLDEQPVFVPDNSLATLSSDQTNSVGVLPPVARPQVERPQGVETIMQTVTADGSVLPASPSIPTAATVDIADADSNTANKRITVNTRAGGWNWPVLGTITRDFDLREINRQGLDIDPGADAAVQAASDGEVVYSGRDLASYGNLVILRHENNFLSAYSKVSEIFVEENQKVKAGEVIASVGQNDTGSHEMHFEIRQNGEPVNPVDYLPAL